MIGYRYLALYVLPVPPSPGRVTLKARPATKITLGAAPATGIALRARPATKITLRARPVP